MITTIALDSCDARAGEPTVFVCRDYVPRTQCIQALFRAVWQQYRGVADHALDDQHATTWRQAAVGGGQVPLPDLLPRVGAVSLFGVLDRVVDHEAVAYKYFFCKEATRVFHLEVIDEVRALAVWLNHGKGVVADL